MSPPNPQCLRRAGAVSLAILFTSIQLDASADPVDFSLDVRPILSNSCFTCHGPDDGARQADLRLDVRELAVDTAFMPGDAEASELIRRVTSADPEVHMPPVDSHRAPLDDQQIELLRRWISEGAKYDKHWSFRTPRRPTPPSAKRTDWVRNPIDSFILARLEGAGMSPSVEADRRTLLRRLSFDLIGLPPSAAAVAEFDRDESLRGYRQQVDRLLDCDHFGERMAMYWLDVVRYADTNGIHGDNSRPHSSYRDWVIRAFNENMPFDQFVTHQLAGDLLPDATYAERIASGFNRLNMTTREGGAQPKEYVAIYQADRVRNTSAIFMGVTMGCAQCHDHKFDPFSAHDFYSFAAFFADLDETPVGEQKPVTLRPIRHDAAAVILDDHIEVIERILQTSTPTLEDAQLDWEASREIAVSGWAEPELQTVAADSDVQLRLLEDGSILAVGSTSPPTTTYTIQLHTDLKQVTGLALEVLADDSFPSHGPGRAENGNFVLQEIQVTVNGLDTKIADSLADHSQESFPIAATYDGDPKTGWAILPQTGQSHDVVFQLAEPLQSDEVKKVQIVMTQAHGDGRTIGRFRWLITDQPFDEIATRTIAERKVSRLIAIDRSQRTKDQQQALASHFREMTPLLAGPRDELARLRDEQREIGGPRPILVSMSVEPRTVRVLPRGNWLDDTGELVQPRFPEVFGAGSRSSEGRMTRLDLARWLSSPEHPLVARVYVNRLWKLVFGQGLVRTLDDFGAQGRIPTHPKLLDWLATELIESGWDTKHMLRLMVTSSTYRQSSAGVRSAADPENDLYARQNRYRLDAEMVRDNALAISGLLTRKIGGPSVKPYQPVGYWEHLNFPTREWEPSVGGEQYRRGLYTFWCRTFLHPSMRAFDAPSREECTVDRPRSNTPLSALVLLNDPTYVEAARVFGERIDKRGGSGIADRIGFAFQEALQREPSEDEFAVVTGLFASQLADYASDLEGANELQRVGQAHVDTTGVTAEQAAWCAVARAILNLHETINRE